MDNKVQQTIGDVYCPTCRYEKCVYISTNKTTTFYDCKKCKACCQALNIRFKDQKPTNLQISCFAITVYIVLQRRRVATTKKQNLLHIWRNFSANQIQAHPNLNQKGRIYSNYGIIVSKPHWLIQLTKTSFILSFYTLSVYIKAAWFSQSPTTVLSGLSTLDQIQLLWL